METTQKSGACGAAWRNIVREYALNNRTLSAASEEHLGGCSSCSRDLIELGELSAEDLMVLVFFIDVTE